MDQDTSNKTSLIGEVIERMDANTPINLTKGHTIFISNEESPQLWLKPVDPMTVINPIMNRMRGSMEPFFL